MNKKMKNICFVGLNRSTCDYIAQQLNFFLANYVNITSWCLQDKQELLSNMDADLYLFSSNAVLIIVQDKLPKDKNILVAGRTLNIENLDRLLELKNGMSTLVVASTLETAQLSIDILERFGFGYLTMTPWYPGDSKQISPDTRIAVTMGLSHLVPARIETIIELGTKALSLDTFRYLVEFCKLPDDFLNEISQYYIRALINLSMRRQKIATLNENLKRERDIILNTISEAIIAVNQNGSIVLFNPAAENIFRIKGDFAIGKNASDVLPQIDFSEGLKNGKTYSGEIIKNRQDHYIVDTHITKNGNSEIHGVVATLRPVSEVQKLDAKVRTELRRKGQVARYTFESLLGTSQKLKDAVRLSKKFAKTDLTIFLEAESGCGKEVLAQAIHNYSDRSRGPFIAVNFAALPENLVESELFGYEQGAFSGARPGGKAGLFEIAHTGTIFLDEIGDASPGVQKKLLRVLEEREVRRVGGDSFISIDVRVISATNKDLKKLTDIDMFRTDLFYRLNSLPIILPPLRDRQLDVFILADHYSKIERHHTLKRSPDLDRFFMNYSWPGNIRELQNIIRYISHLVPKEEVASCDHLPGYLLKSEPPHIPQPDLRDISTQDWKTVIAELRNQNLLDHVTAILQEINCVSAINKSIGRRSLVKRLNKRDQPLSEHAIRTCLNFLNSLGMIHSGVTRQGCRITENGVKFIHMLAKER